MRALAMLVMLTSVAGAAPGGEPNGTEVANVIKKQRATLRACYDKLVATDPKRTEVTLVVQFTVVETGTVSEAALEKAVEPKFDDCILGTFKAMKFPSGKYGKIAVKYPLRYRADDPPKK